MSGLKRAFGRLQENSLGGALHLAVNRKFTDDDSTMGKLHGLNLLAKKPKNVNAQAAKQWVKQRRGAATLLGNDKLGG